MSVGRNEEAKKGKPEDNCRLSLHFMRKIFLNFCKRLLTKVKIITMWVYTSLEVKYITARARYAVARFFHSL